MLKERTMVLVRGLSGAGKTTIATNAINMQDWNLARMEQPRLGFHSGRVSADDYFSLTALGIACNCYPTPVIAGLGKDYEFDPSKLADAHQWCQGVVQGWLLGNTPAGSDITTIVVDNTFSCRWEMEPYLKMAKEAGVKVYILDLFDGGLTDEQLFESNVHGVPLETIKAMRERWEHDWRIGNPSPPWERSAEDLIGLPLSMAWVKDLPHVAENWKGERQRHLERDLVESNTTTRLETDTIEE